MAAAAEISNKQVSQLQRTLLDIAKNNNKLRKIPREDRMAGTPLDNSPEFESLLDACRRGDLKTCHELIISGVNINGRDRYDYTPLILVRPGGDSWLHRVERTLLTAYRPVSAVILSWSNCCLTMVRILTSANPNAANSLWHRCTG